MDCFLSYKYVSVLTDGLKDCLFKKKLVMDKPLVFFAVVKKFAPRLKKRFKEERSSK